MNKNKTIKKNHQFKWIMRKGKKANSELLRVYVQKSRSDNNKIGIALRHDIKTSVERNRMKRLIREAYRLEEGKLKKPFNIIICSNTKTLNFKGVHKDLVKCFNSIGLYEE